MSEDSHAKHKRRKHLAMFCLRWGIAIAGIWYVVAHLSIRDRAWVILDQQTQRPVQVSLARHVGENAASYPVIDPATGREIAVPRADVVNEPDQKMVHYLQGGRAANVQLLGLDLSGDLNHTATVQRFLIAETSTSKARWVLPAHVRGYEVKIPHPRDQVGLASMMRNANPWLLWAAILVMPITFIITSYRWHTLLEVLEIQLAFRRTFVLNMVGSFYNSFMPGSTGGDLLKAYYASRQTPHRMRAVISVIVDRVVGMVALIFLGGVMAGLQWDIPSCRAVAVGAIIICAAVLLGLLIFYDPTLHRVSGLDFLLRKLPMQKHVQSAVEAMRLYGRHPLVGLWALIITLPVHATVITSAMFAGMAFGLPLHWAYYWVCVPVIVLSGSIPISPQGAGVMEAFAVLLTRRQGVTVSQAFALAMSIRIVQILWNLTGGIFVLRGGFHAPSEKEQAEMEEDDAGLK